MYRVSSMLTVTAVYILSRTIALRTWRLAVVCTLTLTGHTMAFDPSCGDLQSLDSVSSDRFSWVVTVHTVGRATGTYMASTEGAARWRIAMGDFALTGRGFVVGQLIVTAAHVVYPSRVEIRPDHQATRLAPVVAVHQTSVLIEAADRAGRVSAEIVHLNHRLDLAILRPEASLFLKAMPYRTATTWWSESPGEVSSLLSAGDCIVALVAARVDGHVISSRDAVRTGQVVLPRAVSSQHSVVVGLSPNTVTITTPLFPGDSGSPVMAFDAGQPRIVGVVTSTRHPYEALSYIGRLDPILPIIEALQMSAPTVAHLAQAR